MNTAAVYIVNKLENKLAPEICHHLRLKNNLNILSRYHWDFIGHS